MLSEIEQLEQAVAALEAYRHKKLLTASDAFREPSFVEHWAKTREEIAKNTEKMLQQLEGYVSLLEQTDDTRKEYSAVVRARLAMQRAIWTPVEVRAWMPFTALPEVDWLALKSRISA